MKISSKTLLIFGASILLFSEGCSRSEQRKTDEQLSETQMDARRLAEKAKGQAEKLARQVRINGTGDAEAKLKYGAQDLEQASAKAATKLDHAALVAKVKTKLADNVGLSTLGGVDVQAEDGVVTLRGTVPSAERKRQVERVTAETEGVLKVDDRLQIQP